MNEKTLGFNPKKQAGLVSDKEPVLFRNPNLD